MKKAVIRTVILIALLFLIFFSWLKYRDYRSFQIPIHKGATKLIKINVDGIYKTLAMDFIGSPFYYLKQDKDKKGEKTKKPGNGLTIPANIIAYTLKKPNNGVFIGYLKISDYNAFKPFIKKKFDISSFKKKTDGILLGISENGHFVCAFSQKAVTFAFSLHKINQRIDQKLMDILQGKNCMPDNSPLIEKLKAAEGHIAMVREQGKGQIIFEDGNISLQLTLPYDSIQIPEKTQHKIFDKESSIKAWLNADISTLLNPKTFKLKNNTVLHTDSILRYASTYLDLEIRSKVVQEDSVITFSYNDNFEKIATKTLAKKQVPEIYVSIKTQGQQLTQYLKRQNLLDSHLKFNKRVFPLYQIYGTASDSILQFSTAKNSTISPKKKLTNDFFHLAINFQRLREQNFSPLLKKHFLLSDSLKLSAQKGNGKSLVLDGNIYFSNQNINGFYQLIQQLP